jgi:hypothetical protein
MNTRQHIDALFSGFEETAALLDFKEELESNLSDRIGSLKKKGLDEEAAFDKAIEELGDVSALADELSLKKKQEVFSDVYMKTRSYVGPWRMALYVLCGAVLLFGVISAMIVWFFSDSIEASLGTLLIFGGTGALGFVFLGLTQETAAREAMPWKRALWYVAAVGVFLFGIFVFAMTYFQARLGLPHAMGTLICFVLPSLTLGAFLVLTEKDRSKPWVQELRKKVLEWHMNRFTHFSLAQQERFGLLSGALWISAVALFILSSITVGMKFSWLALVAALVGQMLLLSFFIKENE